MSFKFILISIAIVLTTGCVPKIRNGKVASSSVSSSDSSITLSASSVSNLASGAWAESKGSHLTYARNGCGMTQDSNGRVVMVGGVDANIEYYDPNASAGSEYSLGNTSFAVNRTDPVTVRYPDGRLVFLGGTDASGDHIYSVEMYNPNAAAGSQWTTLDPLPDYRESFAAALLSDGKILVNGGSLGDGNGNLVGNANDLEVLDPSAPSGSQWNTSYGSGGMTTSDSLMIAPLDDGAALLFSYIRMERFDPAGANWAAQWSIPADQPVHTRGRGLLLKLSNGKIFLAGGMYYDNGLSDYVDTDSVEIYNPNGAPGFKWSTADSMPVYNSSMKAIALPNSKVMVWGGYDSNHPEYSKLIQIFDPAAAPGSQWTTLDSSIYSISSNSNAIALSANTVVIGCISDASHVQVIHLNAASGSQVTLAGEDVSRARRFGGSFTLSNGKVIYIGGASSSSDVLSNVDVFDSSQPEGSQWSTLDSLPADARTFYYGMFPVLMPDERVVVLGGVGQQGQAVLSNFVFDASQASGHQWTALDALPVVSFLNGSAHMGLTDHEVLVCGGLDGGGIIARCDVLDINASLGSQFAATDSMHTKRIYHHMISLSDGRVAVIGGATDDGSGHAIVTASNEIYTPTNAPGFKWTVLDSKPDPTVMSVSALLPNGKIFVAGGSGNMETPTLKKTTYLFDPDAGTGNQWTTMDQAPVSFYGGTAVVLHDGRVLIGGGITEAAQQSGTLEEGTYAIFDPTAASGHQWTAISFPAQYSIMGALNLLTDGSVMVQGGTNFSGGIIGDYSIFSTGGQTATITPSGGTAPYTYQVTAGTASVDASGVVSTSVSGDVTIKVTDALGASKSITVTFP